MLKLVAKVGVALVLFLLAVPLVAFALYDIMVYQPHRSEISRIITEATSEGRLPPRVAALVRVAHSQSMAWPASRLLLVGPPSMMSINSNFDWQINAPLWAACVSIHLSEADQLAIVSALSRMAEGRVGFAAESKARFHKGLKELTLEEAATVVALEKSPAATPERLIQRRSWLLERLPQSPSIMQAQAIRFPPHFPPTERWKKFFLGVRWLGPDLSFFVELRQQQAARTVDQMGLWGGGARQEAATVLSRSIAEQLGWASPVFLPDDESSLLFHGPRFRSLDGPSPEEVVRPFEKQYGVVVSPEFLSAFSAPTFGELVDALLIHTHAVT